MDSNLDQFIDTSRVGTSSLDNNWKPVGDLRFSEENDVDEKEKEEDDRKRKEADDEEEEDKEEDDDHESSVSESESYDDDGDYFNVMDQIHNDMSQRASLTSSVLPAIGIGQRMKLFILKKKYSLIGLGLLGMLPGRKSVKIMKELKKLGAYTEPVNKKNAVANIKRDGWQLAGFFQPDNPFIETVKVA